MVTRRGFLRGLLGTGVALGAGSVAACSSSGTAPGGGGATQLQNTFFCFDTVCTIGGAMEQELLDELIARCQWFELILSRTKETSDVSHINVAEGRPTMVEPETAELIEASLGYSRKSDGLFDITIGAVTTLWDFHDGVVPNEEDIAGALPHVGYELVSVDGTTVTLADPLARIDLGGIAKGYVTDDIVARMHDAGVESGFVNLGGNVAVVGNKADGTPWGIGVRDPFDESGKSSVALVRATSGSLVTSGLYERQFEQGGRRYWHILDPRTGWPVESNVVSASVFSERSIDGDGLTKPLFMLGEAEALAFLEGQGVQGILVHSDGTITTTTDSSFELL